MKPARRASTVNVRALLSRRDCYASPPFSRGFSWGAAEIAQLLIDIEDTSRNQRSKDPTEGRLYLGSVALGHRTRDADRLVIDGQQRLIAISLIVACLRDRLPHRIEQNRLHQLLVRRAFNKPVRARVQLRSADQEWFTPHVIIPGATLNLPDEAPEGGPQRLLNSARFLSRAFAGKSPAELRTLVNALLEKTAVVLVQAVDESDESHLYGVLKGRGRWDRIDGIGIHAE